MALNISIGGTTFNLVIASDAIDASLVSLKFLPDPSDKKKKTIQDPNNEQEDRDAIITLNDFTGKLFIRHASNSNDRSREECTSEEQLKSTTTNNEIGNMTTLAKTKEKIKDFDEDLDHIVISNGVEWYGRITSYELKDDDIIEENVDEHMEKDVLCFNRSSLNYSEISDEKEKASSLKQQQQQQPQTWFNHSSETGKMCNVNETEKPQPRAERRSSKYLPPTATDVAAVQSKNAELSALLKKSILSPLHESSEGTNNIVSTNSAHDEPNSGNNNKSIISGINAIKINQDDLDKDSDSSCSTFSENFSYQTLAQTKQGMLRRVTKLHSACSQARIKFKDLYRIFHESQDAAHIQNKNGELPLHVIALNRHILFGRESDDAQLFIDDLIKEYPYSLLCENDKGCIPFTTAIFNWIDEVHYNCFDEDEIFYFDKINADEKMTKIPKIAYADPMVEWSFKMLSEVHRRIEAASTAALTNAVVKGSPEEEFISKFSDSTAHYLFKTLLLINDDVLRYRIFDYSFMKRCYLNQDTVSDWLVVLLSNKNTMTRAVDYFEGLSKLTTSSALGITKPRVTDIARFRESLENVIVKISNMDNILPALFMLNGQDMKRACLTYPVQRMLELSMTDPSLLGLLIFDLCVHLLLVIAFNVQKVFMEISADSTLGDKNYTKKVFTAPILMTTVIVIYLFFREEVTHIFLVKSFRKSLQRYKSVWHVIDAITIILVLLTNSLFLIQGYNASYALFGTTKLFIWLRLFGFLKGINLHLTMFVASVGKIVYHMRWFIVVLMTTMFAIADLMHVITYATDKCNGIDYKTDHSITADYCSKSLLRNTIRPFEAITGNFELDDYRFSLASTVLFVIYLAVGLIILLNVLIAIVTESYLKSNKQKYSLLGRARIPILAKHSYLDTKANYIAQRGRKDCMYVTIMILVILFLLLFTMSFFILIGALLGDTSLSAHSQSTQIVTMYGQILIISSLFIVSIISMFVTIKDWFHLNNKFIEESRFVEVMKRPIVPFVYALLGIDNRNGDFIRKEEGLEEDDILPAVKEMIDRCTLRIRNDLQKMKRTLKKRMKKRRITYNR